MNVSQFYLGLGLAAYGVAFTLLVLWSVKDDARLHRLAKKRWWLDARRARRRHMSQEQWFEFYARGQRRLVKWFLLPVMAIWFLGCAVTVVKSFIGS